jgi:hypothetical protein
MNKTTTEKRIQWKYQNDEKWREYSFHPYAKVKTIEQELKLLREQEERYFKNDPKNALSYRLIERTTIIKEKVLIK